MDDTAGLYQRIISIIWKSFIVPAEKYGLTVAELNNIDPSIEDLILHLNGLNAILKLIAKDNHSEINMSINASQCVVIMERMAQAIKQQDQKEIEVLMLELKRHAEY